LAPVSAEVLNERRAKQGLEALPSWPNRPVQSFAVDSIAEFQRIGSFLAT